MRRERQIKYLSIIAFLLVIGPITWIVYGSEEKEIEYRIEEELKEKGRKAEITVEVKASEKVKEIRSIEMPDGRKEEGKTRIVYEVEENGEYKFIIHYEVIGEEEEKRVEIVYEEGNIVEEIEELPEEQPIEEEAKEEEETNKEIGKTPEVYATGDVEINETNFPDANFRNYLKTNTDPGQINGRGLDGTLSTTDLANITFINVNGKNVASLKGIEHFKALTNLHCSVNQLTELNVSANTLLVEIWCSGNPLGKLDVKKNAQLQYLSCSTNELRVLDVSQNPNLKSLACANNYLTSLDLSNNKTLSSVQADRQTREIPMGLSGNIWKSGIQINCFGMQLTQNSITFNNNTGRLTTNTTNVSTSDFTTQCKDGKGAIREISGTLTFTYNGIVIDEYNFPDANFRNYLKTNTDSGQINGRGLDGTLSTTDLANITFINVNGKNVASLKGIEHFKALTNLHCSVNQLTELNVSANTLLVEIWCSGNPLGKLDVKKNAQLQYLSCSTNELRVLDVSQNPNLKSLACANNYLTSLDLSNNKTLSSVQADRQTREIPMTFSSGQWKSATNYGITSIDNTNMNYNQSTGQFSIRYATNLSSNFTTECKGGNGKLYQLSGTLSFTYQGYVPVSNITGVITSTTAGASVPLIGTITPTNASEKTITWSIKSVGTTGATISNTTLTTVYPGTLVVTATVTGGTLSGPFTKDFTITVAYGNPSSLTCTYHGTLGKSGWYTSDVTVSPPIGYEISLSLNNGYMNTLTYTTSTTPVVYLKETSSGILYSAKTLAPIKIDKSPPVITGISDGENSIATNITATITDDNLQSVVLFTSDTKAGLSSAIGSFQTVTNGSSTVPLTAYTKNQYFRIEAEDEAGLKTVYTYTLTTPTYEVEVQDVDFGAVDFNYSSVAGIQLNINVNVGNQIATITSITSSDTGKFVVSGSGMNWTVTPVIGLPSGKHSVILTTSYDGGRTTISKAEIVVRVNDPIALISIPQGIDMERIRGDNLFEATKEEWVSLKTTTDTDIYPLDFYIMTEPSFPIFHTVDSDEYFKIQVYDSQERRHPSLSTPIAILNGSHRSEKFYLKAFKDIARKRGIYEGTMVFQVGYGGPP